MQTALNSKRKLALITGLLSVLLFAPPILAILGFRVPLPSFFLGLSLLASFSFFFWAWQSWKEANQISSALDGRTTIAHWKYTTDECQRYVELWFPSEVKKRGLLSKVALILAWLIVVVVSIGIINRLYRGMGISDMPTPLLVSSLAAMLFLAYSYLGRLGSFVGMRQPNGVPEAFISSDGVIINNHYTCFHKLINVSYSMGDPSIIEFIYQVWSKHGMKNYKVGVPVPPDQEGQIDEVIRAFGYRR